MANVLKNQPTSTFSLRLNGFACVLFQCVSHDLQSKIRRFIDFYEDRRSMGCYTQSVWIFGFIHPILGLSLNEWILKKRLHILKTIRFSCSSIPLTGELETFFLRKTSKYNEYSCGFSQSERFNLTGHWAL